MKERLLIMERNRINLSHRIVAFLLACTMIITMMPYQFINASANEGIGICNNVLTGQTGLQTVYHITLYRTVKTEVPPRGRRRNTFLYICL